MSGRKPTGLLSFVGAQTAATPSPNDPCAVCTTGTDPNNFVDDEDTFGNNSIFLWVRFINVPVGSYMIDVTPMIQPKGSSCVPATPFVYETPSTNVDFWILPAGGLACHPHALADLPAVTSTTASLPVSGCTTAATQDLLVRVHMKGACTGTHTVTGLLTNCQGQTVLSCTHDYDVP